MITPKSLYCIPYVPEEAMAGETVRVVAHVTSQPDKVEEVKTILQGLVGKTRTEKGCISYQLFQNKLDPGDFVFIEEWASDDALNTHLGTPHLQEAFSKVVSLLARKPDIRRYVLIV